MARSFVKLDKGINLPNLSVTPTGLTDGDIWRQGNKLWAQLNGLTVELGKAVFIEAALSDNEVTPIDVTGLLLDSAENNAAIIEYSINRGPTPITEDAAYYAIVTAGANNTVHAGVMQADNKVLIGGAYTDFGINTRRRLTRVEVDGTDDAAFYTNLGTGFNGTVRGLAVQSDDDILVVGEFTTLNGNTRNRMVRLNSDGTNDAAFYTNLGTGFDAVTYVAAIQADNKILVGGAFTSLNGNTRNNLVRLNSNGTEDAAFYTNLGTGFDAAVYTICVQNDAKILVGGTFTTLNGTSRNYLVRLNSDGTVDTTFYTNLGTGFDGTVENIAVQSDNKILVAGSFTALNGNTRNRLVRLNADGTEDAAFYTNLGTGFDGLTQHINITSSGIIVAGGFTALNGNTRNRLVRINTDGTEDTGFYADLGTAFNGQVTVTVADSTNGLIALGAFANFNGSARSRINRINLDSNYVRVGNIFTYYKFGQWNIGGDSWIGDDTGIILSVTSGGQVQYVSTNIDAAGVIRFIARGL